MFTGIFGIAFALGVMVAALLPLHIILWIAVIVLAIYLPAKLGAQTAVVHNEGAVLLTSAGDLKLATAIAEKGFTVFVGVSSLDAKRVLQDELRHGTRGRTVCDEALLDSIVPVVLDVSKLDSIQHVFTTLLVWVGQHRLPLVAVIHNAPLVSSFGPIEMDMIDSHRTAFDANYFGVVLATMRLLPLVRASQGRIIVVSCGGHPRASWSIPSATHAATSAFMHALRSEVGSLGVGVSMINVSQPWITPQLDQAPAHLDCSSSLKLLYARYFSGGSAFTQRYLPRGQSLIDPLVLEALFSPQPRVAYQPLMASILGWVELMPRALLPDRAVDWICEHLS